MPQWIVGGRDTFKPLFTDHGFPYIIVTGMQARFGERLLPSVKHILILPI